MCKRRSESEAQRAWREAEQRYVAKLEALGLSLPFSLSPDDSRWGEVQATWAELNAELDRIRARLPDPSVDPLAAARRNVTVSLTALRFMRRTGTPAFDPGGFVRGAHDELVFLKLSDKPPEPDTTGMSVNGAIAALDELLTWIDSRQGQEQPASVQQKLEGPPSGKIKRESSVIKYARHAPQPA